MFKTIEFLLLPPLSLRDVGPVISAIPDNWTYVQGDLHLLAGNKTIPNLRCTLGDLDPKFTRWDMAPAEIPMDYLGWLTKGGSPEFVDIEYPGQYGSRPAGYMARMKGLFVALVGRGYYPNLEFFRDAKNPEWNGAICRLSTLKRIELTLTVNSREGGSDETIQPIVKACQSAGWCRTGKR
ncbi:MAG: hypothetical protein RDU25_01195 [Patescibacteria group bacterium]|nr:hypothetical protein [Patescibacteria group bacterium]